MSNARFNRRAARFQFTVDKHPSCPCTDVPMAVLQRLAGYVWASESVQRPAPRVVAGRGTPADGLAGGSTGYTSYEQAGKIVLARTQRNVSVLLHELAHAMHPRGYHHGPAWLATYKRLLVRYGGVDPEAFK